MAELKMEQAASLILGSISEEETLGLHGFHMILSKD